MILVASSPAEGVSIPEAEWFADHLEKLGVTEAEAGYVILTQAPHEQFPESGAFRFKLDLTDPENPVVVPIKPKMLALTCDGELIEERYYKAVMGSTINFVLTVYDGVPPDLAKITETVLIVCDRGVLSQQEFVLDGNTTSVNFQWTAPNETIECKLRAKIPSGDPRLFINRSTRVLLTNPA